MWILLLIPIAHFCCSTSADRMVVPYIPPHVSEGKSSDNATTYLNVCVTLEEDSIYIPTYKRVAAAVDLGVSNANEYLLPPSIKLRKVIQPAGPSCSQIQHSVTTNLIYLMQSGVTCDTYVGIGCASSAVALYAFAEAANVPVFSCPGAGIGSLALNATRNKFPLMLRIPYGYVDLALSLTTFFERYSYYHISIFRDDSYTFHMLTSRYLITYFRQNNRKISLNTAEIPFFSRGMTKEGQEELLSGAQNRSRVIILLSHARIVRQFMLTAKQMGLTQGEYVFFAVEMHELKYWGRLNYIAEDKEDNNARQAFQSLFVISLSETASNSLDENLASAIRKLARERYNYSYQVLEKPDPVVMSFYESIMIYAQEVASMTEAGEDFRNGSAMVARIMNTEFVGITGYLSFGNVGDRDRNFDLKSFNPDVGTFEGMDGVEENPDDEESFLEISRFNEAFFAEESDEACVPSLAIKFGRLSGTQNHTFLQVDDTLWFANGGNMPPDKPLCGFRNDECKDDGRIPRGLLAVVVVIPLLALFFMAGAAVFALIKLRNLRKDYDPNWWKILMDDLTVKQNRTASGNMSKKTLV